MGKCKKYTEGRLKHLIRKIPLDKPQFIDEQQADDMLKKSMKISQQELQKENAVLRRQKKRYAVVSLMSSIVLLLVFTFSFPQVQAFAKRVWLQIVGNEQDMAQNLASYNIVLDDVSLISETSDEFIAVKNYSYKNFIVNYIENFSEDIVVEAYSDEADAEYFAIDMNGIHVENVVDSTGSQSIIASGKSCITVVIAGSGVTKKDITYILSGLESNT